MRKVDPYARRLTSRKAHLIEGTQPADDSGPEETVQLLVRPQNVPDAYLINDVAESLARKYVPWPERFKYEPQPGEAGPELFLVNELAIRVSEAMCRDAAVMFVMQSPVDEEGAPRDPADLYTVEQLLAMAATMSIAFLILKLKASSINSEPSGPGKDPADSLEPSSLTEPPTIPSS